MVRVKVRGVRNKNEETEKGADDGRKKGSCPQTFYLDSGEGSRKGGRLKDM